MAAVADSHHPWAFTFGILGNLISFLVYLAPVPTFYWIFKKKSAEGFQSVPYLVALFSATLWLYYALVKKNAMLLITINSFGSVIMMVYIIVYMIYATKSARKLTLKLLGVMNIGMFSVIILLLQFIVKSEYRVSVLGWINVGISVCVFASPLSIVAQVIRTKSVEFMPFGLSFFLTLSAVMWFAYGLLLKDICIALPNILGFVLGLLQMLLYALYRNRKVLDDQEKKLPAPEHVTNIVILSTITSSEVHPVDAKPCDDAVEVDDVDGKDEKERDGGEHDKCVVVLVDVSGEQLQRKSDDDESCATV